MGAGVRLQLVHEMPSVVEHTGRHSTDFEAFFDRGVTPKELLDAGIYRSIAVPLKGGEWRQASLLMVAQGVDEEQRGLGPGRAARAVRDGCVRFCSRLVGGIAGTRRRVGHGESKGGLMVEMAISSKATALADRDGGGSGWVRSAGGRLIEMEGASSRHASRRLPPDCEDDCSPARHAHL